MTCKKSKGQAFLIIIISFSILFIWSNSIKNSSSTMNESNWVKDMFVSIGSFFGIDIKTSFFVEQIRKFGHFTEFLILGGELMLYNSLFHKVTLQNSFNCLFIGFFTALIDETIQLIPALGRSSEVRDVWIDISGAFCGLFIVFIIFRVIVLARNKKKIV